jgi:hypothetical protein
MWSILFSIAPVVSLMFRAFVKLINSSLLFIVANCNHSSGINEVFKSPAMKIFSLVNETF